MALNGDWATMIITVMKPKLILGDTFERFEINEYLLNNIDTDLANKMRWFANDFYVINKYNGKIGFYNLQCDMQGIKRFKDYTAPTAFYFELKENTVKSNFKTNFHK